MNGIFAVRKPSGPTSQDVVAKLKHIFTRSPQYSSEAKNANKNDRKRGRKQKFIKIGHGGTLDPLADGVSVIGVGTGTKQLANYLGQCSKVYTARALLGASTTTYDSEGAVIEYGSVDPKTISTEDLDTALEQFRGSIKQLPPVFSALKMDGKPLYEYAREGIPLPRPIEPRDCEVSQLSWGKLQLDATNIPDQQATPQEREFAEQVTGKKMGDTPLPSWKGAYLDSTFSVSSGTYIRTLINDIGEALGTKAHMVKLTRDSQGEWESRKNVFPLHLFERSNDTWWPSLETTLKEGPKRRIEESAFEEQHAESNAANEETKDDNQLQNTDNGKHGSKENDGDNPEEKTQAN